MKFTQKAGSRWLNSPLALALGLFLLALGPRVLDLGVFVGPDEFSWVERSANFTQALAEGNLAQTYQTGHPGVTVMWLETMGSWLRWLGGEEWPAALAGGKTMSDLGSKRQVIAVANALIIVGCALLLRRLFGSGVAWLAGFLLAFDPFLLTESRALRTEGLVTGFSTLTLFSLLLYLKTGHLRYSALAGLLTGLALLSKISAVALLPIGIAISVIPPLLSHFNRPKDPSPPPPTPQPSNLPTFQPSNPLPSLLLWPGLTLLTVLVLWPALWVAPLDVARQMAAYVGLRAVEGEGGGAGTFFWGQPMEYQDLGSLFYPVALLYRTGPWVWLGLLLLIALACHWAYKTLRTEKSHSFASRLLASLRAEPQDEASLPSAVGLMLLYLAVYLALITRSELKIDRYIIPMLPILDVLAALGLVAGWGWLAARAPRMSQLAWVGAGVLIVSQLLWTLPHHPYYYTYWNPLLGGLQQTVHVLPVGEGEGLDQVAAFLNTLPQADTIKVASANSQKIQPLFKGQTVPMANTDGLWTLGDYVFIYISQLQRGKHDPNIIAYLRRQAPLYTLTLHGVEYAWVYPGPAAQTYGGGFTLEGQGTLYGYDLCPACPVGEENRPEIAAGETLPLTLYWRNEGQGAEDRFFVRLVDPDGYVWAEALAQPRPAFVEASHQRESIMESEAVLTLPVGMPPGDYSLTPGFRTDSGQIIGYFKLPDEAKPIRVSPAKTYPLPETLHPSFPVQVQANADLRLLGYDLEPPTVTPGAAVWLTLYWQALTDVSHDYVILVRLIRGDTELAYWLGRPVRSGYPTSGWQASQVVMDPWQLLLPAETAAGPAELEIALFDADTEAEVVRSRLGSVIISAAAEP